MDRILERKEDVENFVAWLRKQALPLRVSATRGALRSLAQNKLQGLWIKELATQMHETPSDVRAFLKLTIGIPILRENHPGLREKYDKLLKPMSYENKLAMMQEPMPVPVTSLFTSEEMTEYLDRVQKWASSQGFELTDPSVIDDPAVKEVFKNFADAEIKEARDV